MRFFLLVKKMNTGSPLSKDQRIAKDKEDKFVKPKQPISGGAAKKILKGSGATIGAAATAWFNRYMENRVAGECLPKSFLSSDIHGEICRTYGTASTQFIERIVADFKSQNSIQDSTDSK